MQQFNETLYDAYGQQFRIDKIYFEEKTKHQHLMVFHNAKFGRVMALDGIIQTTEKDEFIYHEMLTHVPIMAHGEVESVLIIGGGDGGMLREVSKHTNIKRIVQVEIDETVIDICKTYLPKHSAGAFDDPRVEIVIDDGLRFVQSTTEKFDVIISDCTDPIGPGKVLFSSPFYEACHEALTDNGIFVAQNGVAFMQPEEIITTHKKLSATFSDSFFYSAAVPTYIGGIMTFAWGAKNVQPRQKSEEALAEAFANNSIDTRYYNAAIHKASFALPQYILNFLS